MAEKMFLSYSTDDIPTATLVRDHLEAQGIACWMAHAILSQARIMVNR
jgi:hypothetical protein